MKNKIKPIVCIVALALTGCSNRVDCWYATTYTQQIGEPWLALHGRTPAPNPDISGPMFKAQAELESYVSAHKLRMCGGGQ